MNWTKHLRWLLPIGIAGLLFLFLRHFDFTALAEQMGKLGWNFLWILRLTFIGHILATMAWAYCFEPNTRKVGFFELFIIRLIGESVALINPSNSVAGDTLKGVMLNKRGETWIASSSSTTIYRLLIFVSAAVLPLLTLPFLPAHDYFQWFFTIVAVGFAAIIFSAYYSVKSEKHLLSRFIKRLSRRFFGARTRAFSQRIRIVEKSIGSFGRKYPRRLDAAFILSLIHWLSGTLEIYVIAILLQVPLSLEQCLIIEMGMMLFRNVGSFVPGQLGFEELGSKLMTEWLLTGFGWFWLALSLLRRARQLFWLVLGLGSWLIYQQVVSKKTTIQSL